MLVHGAMVVPYKCLLKAVQSGAGSRAASARDNLSGKGKNLMGRGSTKLGGKDSREGKEPKREGKISNPFLFFVFI